METLGISDPARSLDPAQLQAAEVSILILQRYVRLRGLGFRGLGFRGLGFRSFRGLEV